MKRLQYKNLRAARGGETNGAHLEDMRILSPGRVMLDGCDAQHRLGVQFDNVMLDDLGAELISAAFANIGLGSCPVDFRPNRF